MRRARLRILSVGVVIGGIALAASMVQAIQPVAPPSTLDWPSCPQPVYATTPRVPDALDDELSRRKRYRLVIGASTFQDDPGLNRPFVEATARLIDARLAGLGYAQVPSFAAAGDHERLLTGERATKRRVWDAIRELATVTGDDDIAIIYYVGHGTVTPSTADVSLAVHDRPVAPDEGIRVSDIIGQLSLYQWRSQVQEIPKFILVIESCYAGNALVKPGTVVESVQGLQRLRQVTGGNAPPQFAVLTATASGDLTRAYRLRHTDFSAFGYLFARALNEDWACVDKTEDGVITMRELEDYLMERLEYAHEHQFIEGAMTPVMQDADQYSFVAVDSSRALKAGERQRIVKVLVKVTVPGRVADVTLSNGVQLQCSNECSFSVSTSFTGAITVRSRLDRDPAKFGLMTPRKLEDLMRVKEASVGFQDLLEERQRLTEDVLLTIK